MARPVKIGIEYFSLDVDIFEDEKVIPVSSEFGAKGECVIIRVLCAIYRNGYFAECSEAFKFKIAKQANLPESLISEVISGLIRWGFFDKAVFDSFGVLTSRRIQKNWKQATRKRVEKIDLDYWILELPDQIREFPAEETPLTQAESTQSKLKESKVNRKNNTSSPKTGEVKVEKPVSDFYLTKKKRKLTGKRLETFLIFWKKFNYPQGKAEAADSWIDIPELTASLCEKINLAAEMEAKRRPELELAGKTPKMAQGWISARRWEDEIYIKKVSKPEQSKIQRCER